MAELASLVVCGFCREQLDRSLLDAFDTVQSCPQCGSVLAEEQIFNYDMQVLQNTSSKSPFVSYRNEGGNRNTSQFRSNARTPAENALKKIVQCSCETLQLSKEITDQVEQFLLSKVYNVFINANKKIRLAGACIYIVCRSNGLPVTLKQVAVATGCTVFELGNVAKLIDAEFGLNRAPVTVQGLITSACSDLLMGKECEELALRLCRRSQESLVLNGTPLPQAIAHCVLASLAVNKGSNQAEEITRLCLKMSQVSESTVLHCIRSLKKYMITLLKAIPWVDMKYVKMANVHHYIKDIIKYEQNCGKFPAQVADPQWCQDKEKEISLRKVKIENALERIRLRGCIEIPSTSKNEVGFDARETLDANDKATEELNSLVATDGTLDEEDKVIEELLDLGCSPEQLQEGFYQNLKTTSSSVNHEIADSEIESYVRKPDEVDKLKRVLQNEDDLKSAEVPAKKRQVKQM